MSAVNSSTAAAADKTEVQPQTARKGRPGKAVKPRPEFPLGILPTGYFCKRIKGTLYYFGPRFDTTSQDAANAAAEDALADYNRQLQPLLDGKLAEAGPERPDGQGSRVPVPRPQREDGGQRGTELSNVPDLQVGGGQDQIGVQCDPAHLRPRRRGLRQVAREGREASPPHGLGTFVQAVRCLFKHAFDNGLIERPVHFGSTFKKVLRRHRAEQGAKLFTADEIRRLVAGAIQPFKAMLLLAINGGMGNSDVGNLPFSALDLDAGWITYPRPKTGVPRRFALWPETVAAIREAVAARPEPKNPDHAGLVFITLCGDSWSKETAENPVSDLMAKLLHKLEITGRKGLGFYTLRHVFRTVADEAKDPVAADHIMGHEVANMSSVYREGVGDERLQAVADHVHGWLYPTEKKTRQRGKRKATVNPA